MQYSKSPTISRLFRPASLFCAGFFVLAPLTAAVAVAGQQQVAVNTAVTAPVSATPVAAAAKTSASDIARWSDTVWNAARSGDLETVGPAEEATMDDRERAAFVDNALKYEATLRFLNSSVRTMLEAMKSHNG